ncbi:PREDICTED: trimethylguanosine synthase-like [Dinoponera quadriceps]|uniref:Trimethylguanosine synthase n=1 Tax=Dinoponera quadriceps TaxID=609295 RepID=A0A6P3X879_DINQU|nr:PREDICTED: trimethylguanosine synthase-like [Dinoponera quadriceps]
MKKGQGKKNGQESSKKHSNVSLQELVFKKGEPLLDEIIFKKHNVVWREEKREKPKRRRLSKPCSIDDKKSSNTDFIDLEEENSEFVHSDNSLGKGRCISCNSLDVEVYDDFSFRKINNHYGNNDSSSSDLEDDEFELRNDQIIFSKLTELDVHENNISHAALKKCRKSKKIKTVSNYSDLPKEIQEDRHLVKYWQNRYELFHLFDGGIKLDRESWYSVTPERIAKQIARRCKCNIIIDAFCGAGGNTIQFASMCKTGTYICCICLRYISYIDYRFRKITFRNEEVMAIDINPEKIELARNNARVNGVEDNITFVVGDFLKMAPALKADVVFLSPPWGGPDYSKHQIFDINSILPVSGKLIYKKARQISSSIAYYLPKNINVGQIRALAKEGDLMEIEKYLEGDKEIAVTCYYGGLVMKSPDN